MILLHDVVQVLDRPVAATASQESFLFHPGNRRAVKAGLVRVDDTGLRMRRISEPSWLLRSSATDAACLRRPSVVVVEPAQHREGHDAPAGLYAARPLPLVRDPLPDPLVRSPPVEVSHPFGEHAA